MERIGGIINVQIDGVNYRAKGEWSYGLGVPKKEAVVGTDGVHGFKETPQVAYIEGEVTDSRDLDHIALASIANATVTLQHGNGKVIVIREAWQAGDAIGHTEEGNIDVRFESAGRAEVIK